METESALHHQVLFTRETVAYVKHWAQRSLVNDDFFGTLGILYTRDGLKIPILEHYDVLQ